MQSNIKLIIVDDPLDYVQTDIPTHTRLGSDLFDMVSDVYPNGPPKNTNWYQNTWDTYNDVTPINSEDIAALNAQGGTIYIVTYPGDPITAVYIAISIVVSVAVAFLMPMPTVPGAGSPSAPPSPNNALSQRTNRPRLGGRVPAIFGDVWAVPDLTAQTYSVYINHEQIEYSDMCIGEGYYDITAAKDETTAIGLIGGANVRTYNPGVNAHTQLPTLEFGNSLTAAEQQYDSYLTRRYSSVNGQVLAVPENYLICNNNVVFEPPNIVKITSGTGFDTSIFTVGETLQVEDADSIYSPSSMVYNLSGFYTITSSSSTQLTLNSPELVNTAWATLSANDTQTNNASAVLSTESRPLWQGWHYITENDLDIAIINFVAPQGIYTTHLDGDKFAAFDIALIVEVQGLDSNSQPYPGAIVAKFDYRFFISGRTAKLNAQGTAYTFTSSEEARQTAALTQTIGLFKNPGGSRIRVRRDSRRQKLGKQYVADEVKFVDLYSAIKAQNSPFAHNVNATLVKTKTKATGGATSLKERKLTLLAQRRIKDLSVWQGYVLGKSGDSRNNLLLTESVDFKGANQGVILLKTYEGLFETTCYPVENTNQEVSVPQLPDFPFLPSASQNKRGAAYYFAPGIPTEKLENQILRPSNRIDDIIYHIATGETTGGLTSADLNMTQITDEVDAQIAYFGTDLCAKFCGTFDNVDISTEEMIQTVASAGFFTAYRINNKIHLHFERAEPSSVVTFNSHNITPDSFEYAESFGARAEYDGVEVTYTDPKDDAKVTLSYPSAGGVNPQKIELVGVRNNVQAHMQMMRAYHKDMLSYSTCAFTGADESAIVIPTNRISVANQTRADTQQGVVMSMHLDSNNETLLTLSDPVDFGTSGNGTIFIQTEAATVERIICYQNSGNKDTEVVLFRPPSQSLSLSNSDAVRSTYQFVPGDALNSNKDSYLVTAKEPGDNPFTHRLTCVNYTDKYYQNDRDFIKNNVRLDT